MQLYMGEFRQRCYDPLSHTFPEADGVLCLPDDALLLGGAPSYISYICTYMCVCVRGGGHAKVPGVYKRVFVRRPRLRRGPRLPRQWVDARLRVRQLR